MTTSPPVPDPHLATRLRTLTPLWTGGIDGDCRWGPKESGILGSLRFWFERVLRSNGLSVRDPKQSEPNPCPACELFGATGCARRFRLEVDGLEPVPVFFRVADGESKLASELTRYFLQDNRAALWSPGNFTLTFRPRADAIGEWTDIKAKLVYTVSLIAELGGLGAKTQHGFGQIAIVDAQSEERSDNLQVLVDKGRSLFSAGSTGAPRSAGFTVPGALFFSFTAPFSANIKGWVDHGTPPAGFDETYIPCAPEIRESLIRSVRGFPPIRSADEA